MWLDVQLLGSSFMSFIALSTHAGPGTGLGATATEAAEAQSWLERSSELLGESLFAIETMCTKHCMRRTS